MSRFLRPGWLVVYVIVIVFLWRSIGSTSVQIEESIVLAEGSSIARTTLFDDIGTIKTYKLKRFLRKNEEQVKTIKPGTYEFEGEYSFEELLEVFLTGPSQQYSHFTILEGWSSFDIDAHLVQMGVAEPGAYRAFIQNQDIIGRYAQRYEFIGQAVQEEGTLRSLEGYLYPSTYYVDPELNILDQLVYLQLEAFKKNIWEPYGAQLISLNEYLQRQGYGFSLSTYEALKLAAIIEKEERRVENRVLIASVFYNRLNDGMRIDADISLCYGLGMTHKQCTPAVIGGNVRDASNPYNTRAVSGLTPTPISSITASSVAAVVTAVRSDNYYYLHDAQGQIHFARNLSEHNVNKSKYIN